MPRSCAGACSLSLLYRPGTAGELPSGDCDLQLLRNNSENREPWPNLVSYMSWLSSSGAASSTCSKSFASCAPRHHRRTLRQHLGSHAADVSGICSISSTADAKSKRTQRSIEHCDNAEGVDDVERPPIDSFGFAFARVLSSSCLWRARLEI